MKKILLGAALLLAASVQAFAGVYMVNESRFPDKKEPMVSRMSVGENAARMEMDAERGNTTVIFRSDKQVFWMINDKDKSYREMTKADVEKMAAKADAARAKMAESMKKMSPEQKAMMEKFMPKGAAAGAAPVALHYVKKASGEKAGKWTADRYETNMVNQSVHRIWTVPQGTLDIRASDMAVMKEMAKFFEKLGNNKSDYFKFDGGSLGFTGIPVQSEVVEKGTVKATTQLIEATRKSFPASTFELPAGYVKKNLQGF